jgi:protein ImuA
MPDINRATRLDALRESVRAIERGGAERRPVLPFGVAGIDDRLAEGGIAGAALHEAAGADAGMGADAAATLFLAGIAGRLTGQVLWVVSRRDLFAPGLQQAGLPPDRVIYAETGQDADTLAVMEEGLRHGSLAAVIGEASRAGLTATRRLQLAAEAGGTTALLLRRWKRSGADPMDEPSAAVTRWKLAPAPSAPLPVAGIGRARWQLSLVRQRGGDLFDWTVEANDAAGRLALPAGIRDRAGAADRPADRAGNRAGGRSSGRVAA